MAGLEVVLQRTELVVELKAMKEVVEPVVVTAGVVFERNDLLV